MADKTEISWTDSTWSPITGCCLASEGCRHCYAATLAATRLKNHPSRAGLARMNAAGEAKFTGEVRFNEAWLDQPLRWKRPRLIFVCAHADLFYDAVPDEWIDRVFAVMALSPQHVFQVLTKRPERARAYSKVAWERREELADLMLAIGGESRPGWYAPESDGKRGWVGMCFPLPNVWLGVSVEDQATADQRVPVLLDTSAARRWVSYEPALGEVDFTRVRPSLFAAHINALTGVWQWDGVPFDFKQWGEWEEWPDHLFSSEEAEDLELRDRYAFFPGEGFHSGAHMLRTSKKAAGRLLDGREHDGFTAACREALR